MPDASASHLAFIYVLPELKFKDLDEERSFKMRRCIQILRASRKQVIRQRYLEPKFKYLDEERGFKMRRCIQILQASRKQVIRQRFEFSKKAFVLYTGQRLTLLTTYNTSVLSYAAPLTVSNRRGLLKFSPRLRSDIHQFALYRALTAPDSLRLCKKTTVSFNAFSYGDIITYITI